MTVATDFPSSFAGFHQNVWPDRQERSAAVQKYYRFFSFFAPEYGFLVNASQRKRTNLVTNFEKAVELA